ncbi:MAG: dTDP-4-dehydrorhamnose 3,5-epimerase [Lachnospiraceae bacterium]|nr:dTDP-4-dehydrorhamnose 3,5-epimerase [Lachnospiraceae bacterium]
MSQSWSFENTKFEGVKLIKPFIANDMRGSFVKDFSKEVFAQNGLNHNLEEVFYTISYKGVIRAIHFQREKPQAKLVRCVSGHIYDVVVDLRKSSPTFGEWQGFHLNGDSELLIPGCYGHGYIVLEDSVVSYKCNEKFYGEFDDGIMWNDVDINIDWEIDTVGAEIIIADKDKAMQTLKEFVVRYGGL